MAFSKYLCALGVTCALLATPISAATAKKRSAARHDAAAGGYKGAIVLDASSGRVLFEENGDLRNPPASMTKLMTFAVLKDRIAAGSLSPDAEVTVTAADSKIGGTQVWLKENEKFTVEELIYAMMIQSANDAAYALARTAAGSVPAFVQLMNAKAAELGMKNTAFRSPHGLPASNRNVADGDISSPRDFALLSLHLVQKTDILKYTSVRSRPFGQPQRLQPVVMNNHNHLLGKVAGVDGLKTGYTASAGFCIATTAERNGRRVVVVTMGGADSKSRDLKVAELLETGFAALPPPTVIGTGTGSAVVQSQAPKAAADAGKATQAAAAPAKAPAAPQEEPMIKLNLPATRR